MTAVGTGRRRRGTAFWVGGAIVLVLIALVAGAPGGDGAPLDPASTGPLGTRALVLLLRELGAQVRVSTGMPRASDDVVLLLDDRLDDAERDELVQGWVASGGTLVVADPQSPLAPAIVGEAGVDIGLGGSSIGRGSCDIDALDGVERVDPAGGVVFAVRAGDERCFASEEGAFVVSGQSGAGRIVAVGGPLAFVNDRLGARDNSVLAADLLVPEPETTVALLRPPMVGSGDESLGDLIARRVKQALLQLLVAFVVYALWRARRLGRPIAEPQPSELAGSELVSAVGNLLQQTRSPDRAAATLRRDLRRQLAQRFGVTRDASPEVLATVASARTSIDRDRVVAAVSDGPVASEDELVAVAQSIESIRQEILHGQPVA
jgi:hypothetical protein